MKEHSANPVRQELVRWLEENLPLGAARIDQLLEIPPSADMGDFALPCFELASEMKKAPQAIAQELAEEFEPTGTLTAAEAAGPYLNLSVDRPAMAAHLLKRVHERGERYGYDDEGGRGTVVIDYSSPNIAKHLGVHHLRSAIIGRALYRIYEALGYDCVGINHLGDWGTAFGKLIAAYRRWGDGDGDEITVSDLQELYVRFNRAAQDQPELEEEARRAFRRLEDGEPQATRLWQRFKDVSLAEFRRIYDMLGVSFDRYTGESYYNDRIEETLEKLRSAGLARVSQDALIVPLEDYDMPPLLLRKRDEGSLYATREICAAEERWEQYRFERCLYVVGSEQKLHFRQVKKVLELMGHRWADRLEHVDFGLLKFKDPETGEARTGSTRTGRVLLLEDVLKQGIEKAREKIRENLDRLDEGADVDDLAAAIGTGAVVFSDLCVRRTRDVIFDWDKMLDFEGATGPYVQYAHARLTGIMRKSPEEVTPDVDFSLLRLPEEWNLIRKIELFPEAVARAAGSNEPSIVANYLLELCAEFSAYYSAGMREKDRRVLCDDADVRAARLLLVDAIRHVIRNGLTLLGLEAPERM